MHSESMWTLFFFMFGCAWGSFGNVIIYRLPNEQSVVKPRSHCLKCKKMIPFYLNIPVLSWFFLRGKCFYCKAPFSIRYPIVELITGLVMAYLFKVYGFSWTFLEYSIFSFGLIVSSVIDLDHMILPDRFTLSGIVLGLLGAALNPEREFMDAFWGFLVGGGFLFATAYAYFLLRKIEGMGGGDIKLLGWIGAYCGWKSVPFVLIASSGLGLLFGIFYIMKSKDGLKTGVPFGPYLSAAALIYILFDVSDFMNLFFPF